MTALRQMMIREVICQTRDGNIKIESQLEDETAWLTQNQMAELFGKNK